MEKKVLSAIPVETATADMLDLANRLDDMEHIITASLVGNNKILLLHFYEIKGLKKGNTRAAFRTFLSEDDYITQDLSVSKVKWLTSSFERMNNFAPCKWYWDDKERRGKHREIAYIRTAEEKQLMADFFKAYARKGDQFGPWTEIYRFQNEVKENRLYLKHKKETDAIDAVMEPIKDAPDEFFDWVWDAGMGNYRYLIYHEIEKGIAECECTHCKKVGLVDRESTRLRNNEKGICPFCGSRVTIKAWGKLPGEMRNERWFTYVEPTDEGFVLRHFEATREIFNNALMKGCGYKRCCEYITERKRVFYSFPKGVPCTKQYVYEYFRNTNVKRWCNDYSGNTYLPSALYPLNLPTAWEHTPMKYSAFEVLSRNAPTMPLNYNYGIKTYLANPKLEWVCKMGLNQIVKNIVEGNRGVGKINLKAKTIFEILGLTKVNTRVLQAIDGNTYHLRLLQVAQQVGHQFTPEALKGYYETFECNTDLLKQANRKASLHKLVKYIARESESYPLGESGGCWQYAYNRYREREDPRIERKRNMAKDWLEYLGWCKELRYDLDNMFIYMPKNFKAVHDRTAAEYKALQDRKAAEEKRKRDIKAAKVLTETHKAMVGIFKQSKDVDAFFVNGKGLLLLVPESSEDIRHEGQVLHHCVGTYIERVAKGETNIFFIRKEKEPDKPYYTLEWRDNKIIQCRGCNNCSMTPEVKAFTQVFEEKMLEAIKKSENSDEGKRKAG